MAKSKKRKMKTRKAAAKRIKRTGSGQEVSVRGNKSHFRGRVGKKKRVKKLQSVSPANRNFIRKLIP